MRTDRLLRGIGDDRLQVQGCENPLPLRNQHSVAGRPNDCIIHSRQQDHVSGHLTASVQVRHCLPSKLVLCRGQATVHEIAGQANQLPWNRRSPPEDLALPRWKPHPCTSACAQPYFSMVHVISASQLDCHAALNRTKKRERG